MSYLHIFDITDFDRFIVLHSISILLKPQFSSFFLSPILSTNLQSPNNQKMKKITFREPTEEELEQYIAATMQAASGYFGGLGVGDDAPMGMDDIPEEDEEEDADYDPQDDRQQAMKDEIEDQADDAQMKTDKQDIEAAQKEAAAPLRDVDEAQEEEIVNSSQFERELNEALQCVQLQSRGDKAMILAMAKQAYMDDTGEEPSEDMLAEALKMFSLDEPEVVDPVADEDEEDEQEVDPELFAKELTSALDNIKKLGKAHQAEFVGKLNDTFTELNGGPPSAAQISNIFGHIKEQLAAEAREDFLEINDKEDDEDDSDYKPDADQAQAQEDVDMDEEKEDMVNGTAQKVKILVTPVKRRASGSRVDIYLEDQQEDETKKV